MNKNLLFLGSSLGILFFMCLIKIYLTIQATVLGYDIGELKKTEHKLLREKSLLTMQKARLTTKPSLEKILGRGKN